MVMDMVKAAKSCLLVPNNFLAGVWVEMFRRFLGVVMCCLVWVGVAQAQAQAQDDVVWVQVEAQPSLAAATDRARTYAAAVEDVNGFALGGGWYGIALGPYLRSDAEQVLRVYRREGVIPRDSFIALSSAFRQQFWPVGANVLNRGVVTAPQSVTPTPETRPEPQEETPQVATPAPEPADETPAQAQRSERALSPDARKELQVMLKWAGFYNAAIDGAFGRGTRNSMAAWQEANGFEVTGILTTLQRAALKSQYNAVLDGLGLQTVRDEGAGIEMLLPTDVVTFDKYEPPFAHYTADGDIPAQVLLISQAGDRDTLYGLYDIMQTLEIVPLDGPRERNRDDFVLIGESATMISETRVALQNGQIKGFTLIWPAGDEERRRRLIAEMDTSFTRLANALDPAAGNADEQAIDLVAGLQVRRPRLSRTGFYVDDAGAVVTTREAVQSCTRVTLDQEYVVEIVADDAESGIAVLRPVEALAPLSVAAFSSAAPRLQSDVAVAGYSYEGVLSAPSMTFGTLSDLRGLQGEEALTRLALTTLPGDAGGPVFDASGGVVGMLLPRTQGERALPAEVAFAADGDVVRNVLTKAGVTSRAANAQGAAAPQDITDAAIGMTVLVSCWD